jgi:Glycosyl hydrolase family 26
MPQQLTPPQPPEQQPPEQSQDAAFPRRRLLAAGTAGAAVLAAAALGGCTPAPGAPPSSSGTGAVVTPPATGAGASPTPTPPAYPSVSPARLRLGVASSHGPGGKDFAALAKGLRETPAIAGFFKDFTSPFPSRECESAVRQGAAPMVSLEPWVAGKGVNQPTYSLARIIAGDHDAYLRAWGEGLRDWFATLQGQDHPFLLRFAHEMNGNWYPWGETVNGNQPGHFAAAWRHVHQVLGKAAGDTPLEWVWSPNEEYDGGQQLKALYPGNDVVDVAAVDGYNWGTSQPWSVWRTPEQIFGPSLRAMQDVARGKPLMIAETACAETGGSRPDWLARLVAYLDSVPAVTGVVLFEDQTQVDWRIAKDPAAVKALAKALAARSQVRG